MTFISTWITLFFIRTILFTVVTHNFIHNFIHRNLQSLLNPSVRNKNYPTVQPVNISGKGMTLYHPSEKVIQNVAIIC